MFMFNFNVMDFSERCSEDFFFFDAQCIMNIHFKTQLNVALIE